MDSRTLHKASEFLRHKVTWQKEDGQEWVYFGTDEEMDAAKVKACIQEYFDDQKLHLVHGRTDSETVFKQQLESRFSELLGKADFLIWNTELTKVMEFNKIGVLRKGAVPN